MYIKWVIMLQTLLTTIKTRRTNDKDKEENTIVQSKEGKMKEPPRKIIEEAET
jgi:hypothetical protein